VNIHTMDQDLLLLRYFLIITIVKMQYKYRLIHGNFHIGMVIIPRPPYWPETQSRANMGSKDDNQANMEMPMY